MPKQKCRQRGLGSNKLSVLDGYESDATRRCMDQHALSSLQFGEVSQGLLHCNEDHRHAACLSTPKGPSPRLPPKKTISCLSGLSRLLERPALGFPGHQCARTNVACPQAARRLAKDIIASAWHPVRGLTLCRGFGIKAQRRKTNRSAAGRRWEVSPPTASTVPLTDYPKPKRSAKKI